MFKGLKRYILSEQWHNSRTETIRKHLLSVPGRMVMRLMAGFPFVDVLRFVKERLLWLYRSLHPIPA